MFPEADPRLHNDAILYLTIIVLIDFMIRHGHITADSEPDIIDIITRMHGRLGL